MELLSVRLKAVLRAMLFILIITAAWWVMRANYNIYGNILNNSGGIVDLTANSGSFIEAG